MELSRCGVSDFPEAILREFAKHRFFLRKSRNMAAQSVLRQLPTSGPFSRDNVGLLFSVIGGEFVDDSEFISELRLILPTLAIRMDGDGLLSSEEG